ncbi:MAG: hypothetical protein M3P24_00630 [Gemmatimonadota bacterium]|nr:hypothetical protein [Gemmatimonadota bacterium]
MPSKRPRRIWAYSPKPVPKPKIPPAFKDHVQAEADRFVSEVLRPRFVRTPPEEPRFNYAVDVYTRWYRSYLYFCATYACPGPNAISPSFEVRFARLEYAGGEQFHLAFMRHTGEWIELYRDLTLEAAFAALRDDPFFQL